MFRFLRAGLIAGGLQALIVAAFTFAIVAGPGIAQFTPPNISNGVNTSTVSASTTLAWIDVLTALCLAFLHTRSVDMTASCLRVGFRQLEPTKPENAANSLLVQLVLAAAGFILFALREPPQILLDAGRALGNAGYGAVAWPGIMSVGVAVFATTSHAVLIAKS